MTTVFTQPVFRITCEEEERQREGYQITTHFQFARESGSVRSINAEVTLDAGEASPPLDGIAMSYGQAATIWRINHGWNRARQPGFVLDLQTGTWERSSSDAPEDQRERQHPVNPATRIVVRDTRNVLLVALTPPLGETLSPEQLISLQYALQRGMLQVYQLEEQELSVERVGEGRVPRLLFWETSEGGAGVLHHLAEDATALARVARAALEMCHFDPDSGEDQADVQGKDCSHACYHCLLSYANQPDHKRINRFAVRDVLLSLLTATVMVQQDSPVSPPAISLDVVQLGEQAKRVFAHLESSKRRMPDAVAADMGGCLVPFFYAPSYCILCPDRADDPSIAACRDDLEARGYTVVVISPDQELEPQLARYAFLQHAL